MKETNGEGMIRFFREDYRFLSNPYPCTIIFLDEEYPSSEHLYQALKTRDPEWRERIRTASKWQTAKTLGRQAPAIPRLDESRSFLMRMAVRLKFYQNIDLAERLVSTGRVPLVEGNTWHDNYFGNCVCKDCKNVRGRNELGRILDLTRTEVRYILA